MAHQSAMAAEGADEQEKYLELIWANLVRFYGLLSLTTFFLTSFQYKGMWLNNDYWILHGHQSHPFHHVDQHCPRLWNYAGNADFLAMQMLGIKDEP